MQSRVAEKRRARCCHTPVLFTKDGPWGDCWAARRDYSHELPHSGSTDVSLCTQKEGHGKEERLYEERFLERESSHRLFTPEPKKSKCRAHRVTSVILDSDGVRTQRVLLGHVSCWNAKKEKRTKLRTCFCRRAFL